jgi:hypothetical protein
VTRSHRARRLARSRSQLSPGSDKGGCRLRLRSGNGAVVTLAGPWEGSARTNLGFRIVEKSTVPHHSTATAFTIAMELFRAVTPADLRAIVCALVERARATPRRRLARCLTGYSASRRRRICSRGSTSWRISARFPRRNLANLEPGPGSLGRRVGSGRRVILRPKLRFWLDLQSSDGPAVRRPGRWYEDFGERSKR